MASFEALFRKYHPMLFRQVWFKSRDNDLSEDIAQETFVRVWQQRGSLRPGLSFFALLVRISGNLLKDYYKHESIKAKHLDAVSKIPPPDVNNPEHELEAVLLHERIQSIVAGSFPTRCRTIFILSRIEGKDNKEIAEILQISKKTVENQLTLALKILRKKISIGK